MPEDNEDDTHMPNEEGTIAGPSKEILDNPVIQVSQEEMINITTCSFDEFKGYMNKMFG